MHRRICVQTNIATTKKHSTWLLNGHREQWTEENDALFSRNAGVCLLFKKWFFFCTAVHFFCKKKQTGFNSFISALIRTIWSFILICRTYCIQILRTFLYFQNKYSTVITLFIVGNIWVSHIVYKLMHSV
jgi:hypothetical protein